MASNSADGEELGSGKTLEEEVGHRYVAAEEVTLEEGGLASGTAGR